MSEQIQVKCIDCGNEMTSPHIMKVKDGYIEVCNKCKSPRLALW